MTSNIRCHERESLLSLIYEEGDEAERQRLEAHARVCADCRRLLAALEGSRQALAAWVIEEPARPIVDRWALAAPRRRPWPAWLQAAAAVLLVGAGVGLANVQVRFTGEGIEVRTGWMRVGGDVDDQAAGARLHGASAPVGSAMPAGPSDAWRAELAALEQRLRRDLAPASAALSARPLPASAADAQLRRIRDLVDRTVRESERRQERVLAYRVQQLAREWDSLRRNDLLRTQQGFARIEDFAGQQQQMLNSVLVRVSQQR